MGCKRQLGYENDETVTPQRVRRCATRTSNTPSGTHCDGWALRSYKYSASVDECNHEPRRRDALSQATRRDRPGTRRVIAAATRSSEMPSGSHSDGWGSMNWIRSERVNDVFDWSFICSTCCAFLALPSSTAIYRFTACPSPRYKSEPAEQPLPQLLHSSFAFHYSIVRICRSAPAEQPLPQLIHTIVAQRRRHENLLEGAACNHALLLLL